ncbi:hypothetical protein scyTo_0020780 [Scyliorhinus torazame]|uniref:Sodium/solute symporter n=1 Tax=Scyliorhinus torazame TaxID=75743 RepID=A0A401Q235_SCYTO|nr:hypothetical protein [Scyliorhinus torazame]
MAVNHVFQVWDYVVFVFLLLVSAAIGLFFAFKRGRTGQETTEEFLVGNRQISAYPIALSLASSFLSAITESLTLHSKLMMFGPKNKIGIGPSIIAMMNCSRPLPVFDLKVLS